MSRAEPPSSKRTDPAGETRLNRMFTVMPPELPPFAPIRVRQWGLSNTVCAIPLHRMGVSRRAGSPTTRLAVLRSRAAKRERTDSTWEGMKA